MFKKDLLYLDDILESVHAILDYIEEMDFEAFTKDRKTYSATIREFLRRSRAGGIPWDER